jgi:hypothetical protein
VDDEGGRGTPAALPAGGPYLTALPYRSYGQQSEDL